jgi:hypothetical protein
MMIAKDAIEKMERIARKADNVLFYISIAAVVVLFIVFSKYAATAVFKQAFIGVFSLLLISTVLLPAISEFTTTKTTKDTIKPIRRYLRIVFSRMAISLFAIGISAVINIPLGISKAFIVFLIAAVYIATLATFEYAGFMMSIYLVSASLTISMFKPKHVESMNKMNKIVVILRKIRKISFIIGNAMLITLFIVIPSYMNTALYQQAYTAAIELLLITIIILPFITELLPAVSLESFKDAKNPIRNYFSTTLMYMGISVAIPSLAIVFNAIVFNALSSISKALTHLLIATIIMLINSTVVNAPIVTAIYLILVTIHVFAYKYTYFKCMYTGKQ